MPTVATSSGGFEAAAARDDNITRMAGGGPRRRNAAAGGACGSPLSGPTFGGAQPVHTATEEESVKPFLDSTDAVDDGPELARRMARDGYLFVPGLLPAGRLEGVRRRFLDFARDAGWLLESADPAEALADLEGFTVEPQPEYMAVIRAVHGLEEFHALQHAPELLDLIGRLCGGGAEILPHPRLIPRAIFPQREAYTTPPHQDFIPIQGTESTYTAWIPLSDLSAEMGGVQIAEGSHRGGIYDFRPGLGAGGIEITRSFDGTWRGGPFAQGTFCSSTASPCTGACPTSPTACACPSTPASSASATRSPRRR